MRAISQDGTIDIPYEISSLNVIGVKLGNVEHAGIYCYNACFEQAIKMAQYTTEEKANKAMEMLRAEFRDYVGTGIFQFPAEGELE